jgi:hypothetical protein
LSYGGRRISSQELGAWILNNNATLKYVQRWEDANETRVAWLLDRTAEKKAKWEEK